MRGRQGVEDASLIAHGALAEAWGRTTQVLVSESSVRREGEEVGTPGRLLERSRGGLGAAWAILGFLGGS